MKLVFLVAALLLTPAYSYKFLCNGITAEGMVESDICGTCNDTTATRWPNGNVVYHVDTSIVPMGISGADWKDLVSSCLNIWAQTPGAELTVTYGGEGARSFGTDLENHDIVWVTSETEWRDQVGADPNGILGVTLPPYSCPPQNGETYRVIADADMILNGVTSAGFQWELSCDSLSDECQSIRATVLHESGHVLGLGHPCTNCQAVMSAQAEYLIEYPLFDDQEGIRALYPAGASSAGAFGTACSGASSCQSGLTCHTQSTSQYCSHNCTLSSDCENHMVCNGGFCEFPSGTQLGAVGLHEDCTRNPCDFGLICVGVNDEAAYCFNDCTDSRTCLTSEICHQLSNSRREKINSYACMVLAKQGESCGGITPCQTGQGLTCSSGVCVGGSGSTNSSLESCSSVRAPTEIWILLALLGILVHRSRKKC